jgi:sigma-B regulation protein RsbU (phosphoserine phosphatase)
MGETVPDTNSLQQDFNDFFEEAVCGFLIASPDGKIVRANKIVAGWMGCTTAEFVGKKISDFLTIGAKIYYETHLSPLLEDAGTL